MADSLKEKTVKGTSWSIVDNVANYGITFIIGVILARILSPDEYGLIGIISIFIAVFNIIVDSGFSSALIRKNDADDVDYCTVFYINLIVSIIMSMTLFFCSPLIADFFDRPELLRLSQAMSVVVILNALSIVQKTILTKRLDFKTQTKVSVISHITSGVIGIIMAYKGYGVWSLVAQQITSRMFNTILLWVYNHWYPKLLFSLQSFKYLFAFSWKLLVAQIINTLWQQMYQVVIGKFYNSNTLGQYTRARQFSDIFSTNLTSVVRRVTFPVLSTLQDDTERMVSAYRRLIKVTMLVDFICMLGLAAIAEPLILVLIGEKWISCVIFLQILCFTFMLYPIESLNVNMLTVQGRSDLLLVLEIIQKVIAIVPLLLGIYINIYWMLIGSMIAGWINFFLISHFSGKRVNYPSIQQLKDILPSFSLASGMAIPVWLLSFLPWSPFIIFPLQILLGAILIVALGEYSKLPEYKEAKVFVKSFITKIIHK